MDISKKVQELFNQAGWKPDRNIQGQYRLPYNDYPQIAIDFLNEYGNLHIHAIKPEWTNITNKILIDPEISDDLQSGDNRYPYYSGIIGKKLFPLGSYVPDGYDICCDVDGRVYMIGEYCYYWGTGIYSSIQNILAGQWNLSLQLDEETGKWWDRKSNYVPLP